MKIKVINKAQMEKVFSMKEAIEGDKLALKLYSEGGSDIPLRANLNVDKFEGQSLYMPGYAEGASALGVKIVSVYPNNIQKGLPSVPATMVLLDAETGEVKSLMDGTYLTQLRTGAVSGAATDLLAKKDAEIFVLIGTGGQAKAQLEAVLTVRPIKEVIVVDLDLERANAFAKEMSELYSEKFQVKIYSANNANDVVAKADIITLVTTSKRPVFNGNLVKAGVHINSVGSYTPEMQETPEEILQKAGKIYLDTFDGVLNESGDIITPIQEGKFKKEQITGELGELVAQRKPGRENDEEITWFKSTGSAVLDIVVAELIYVNAEKRGDFVEIEL